MIDLQAYTECLSSLSSSIEFPAEDVNLDYEENPRVLTEFQDRAAHQYYVDLISSRFPNARSNLVNCLGRCNWERYIRLQLAREVTTEEAPDPREEMGLFSKSEYNAPASRFYDSGLGTSIPAQSTYAYSIASFVSSRAESSHVKLPPLSEEAKRGVPFVCDACNKRVQIRRTRDWK